MNIHINEIKSFFEKFPTQPVAQPNKIDYDFFEQAIPKVIAARREESHDPPNLNIFEGFNLGENELQHCSVLSWFLNPAANHCQRQLFLSEFLSELGILPPESIVDKGYFKVSVEDDFSEHGRVDINILGEDFWFIIEVKINANEQDDQIARYQRLMKKDAPVYNIPESQCKIFFLTREGRKPNSGNADICISWHKVAEILRAFAKVSKSDFVSIIAMQYAVYIENNV